MVLFPFYTLYSLQVLHGCAGMATMLALPEFSLVMFQPIWDNLVPDQEGVSSAELGNPVPTVVL